MRKICIYTLVSLLFLVGCNKTSSGNAPEATAASVTVRSNQTIAGFPHQIDYYIPSNATSAIIFLHGGGGKKEGSASDLGIKNDSTTSNYDASTTGQSWLTTNKVMMVFPQGQTISGTSLAFTWNNYVMDSGQNDVAFLQALVSAIKSDSAFSQITKIYLAGHSNGGMMTNRMWCESPTTFDAFVSISGPPSTQLAATGAHPCSPTVVKPFMEIIGNSDTMIQTLGHMSNATWSLFSYNSLSPAWVTSTVLNDKLYHSDRVSMKCAGTPALPTTTGQLTTYSDCSGAIQYVLVSQSNSVGGDHCLVTPIVSCTTTLAGSSGLDYKSAVFNFVQQF